MSLNARLSDWRDKRIWIIGASSGIGAALAHALLELGADVIVSARNQNQLHIEFASYETHCLIAPLDITQIATVDEIFQKILATTRSKLYHNFSRYQNYIIKILIQNTII
jgi:NAD(P)-dependent dehydrogenase (short-subunit alcohol dehydrogenase family)